MQNVDEAVKDRELSLTILYFSYAFLLIKASIGEEVGVGGVRKFNSQLRHIIFTATDHNFYGHVLPLPLIQEEQLSLNDESMPIGTG